MDNDKITKNQYTFIVFSAMFAVGVLSMASGLCKIAKQNGWIPVIIGGIHPLFILTTASIIDKKSNHSSYWEYSNKIYGKKLTYVFTFMFFAYFLTLFTTVVSGYANVLILSITTFLHPYFIIIPVLLFITIIARSGIKIVGRVCEFYFYVTLPLLVLTLFLLPQGNITNILPVSCCLKHVIQSTPVTFFAFAGCEISYFIIGKISNNKNTKSCAYKATFLLVFIYVINVFMVIYNLGWTLTSKLQYPLLYIIQSIEIPIISNFLSIVILLWSIIILRCLLTYCYTTSHIFSQLTKIDYKKSLPVLLIITSIYAFFMIPEYKSKELVDILMPIFVIFSLSWGLLTTILVSVKYRGKVE